MAKWRTLEEYTPFARTLVEYMWEQRPPLLPNQFAEHMGVRKQALSTWLNSDAVPAPPLVVRLAREMGRPVHELMTAAGYASADDPLLDVVDAWAYVRGEVERALGEEDVAGGVALDPVAREVLLTLLHQLQDRAVAPARAGIQTAASFSADSADSADTPGPYAEQDAPADRPPSSGGQ